MASQGSKGEQGERGQRGEGVTRGARRAFAVLALLSLVLSALALLAAVGYYHRSQGAQQRQGEQIELKLCTTLGKLAALKPPGGSPASNPSRAFEQQQHAVLAELGPDVGCAAARP